MLAHVTKAPFPVKRGCRGFVEVSASACVTNPQSGHKLLFWKHPDLGVNVGRAGGGCPRGHMSLLSAHFPDPPARGKNGLSAHHRSPHIWRGSKPEEHSHTDTAGRQRAGQSALRNFISICSQKDLLGRGSKVFSGNFIQTP